MSFGGGSTSDVNDPRSGEATYAGTGSRAGTASRSGTTNYRSGGPSTQRDDDNETTQQLAERVAAARAAEQAAVMQQVEEARLRQAEGGPIRMGLVEGQTYQAPDLLSMQAQYGRARMGRPFQPYAQLFQQGLPSTVTAGFAAGTRPLSQLMARQNYSSMPKFGMMGALPNTASGILEQLEAGGKPVYDPTGQIVGVMGEGLFGGEAYFGRSGFDPLQGGSQRLEDERGALMGYQSVDYTGDMGGDDSGDDRLPGVPVAAVTEAAPEAPRAAPEYIYPEGGFFPKTGQYYRRGLLDIDPGGLLDFTARNRDFRRGMATDASLYGMPYDLSGYTLLA